MRGEQALFNLEIKKKSGLSINPDIHHSKVFSSGSGSGYILIQCESRICIKIEWNLSTDFYHQIMEIIPILKKILIFSLELNPYLIQVLKNLPHPGNLLSRNPSFAGEQG